MIGRIWAGTAITTAVAAMASVALLAQSPHGTQVNLGGRPFWIGDWGYPYWSGNREIYSAHTFKDRRDPSARATINIEAGKTSAGWRVDWTDIDRKTAGQSCAEEERIIRDLARQAGLTVENFQIGDCKTTWMQSNDTSLGSNGGFDFRRTTPLIKPLPKLPSRGGGSTPSPQGSVRFAPLGKGTGGSTAKPAIPAENLPPSVTEAQELAEIATRERLNREQAAFAAKQLADNAAAKAAFDKATADREATIAAQKAEADRKQRDYDAAMAKWRADVEACKNGDISRCAKQP